MLKKQINLGDPHLFGDERELMDLVFQTSGKRYLEFGLGGSTLLALRSGASCLVAVDSDKDWVTSVKANPEVHTAVSVGKACILHANIGSTREWGYPADATTPQLWPHYFSVGWAEYARRSLVPDLVYIDGRFRVACAISVFLIGRHLVSTPEELTVLFHDISDERPEYYKVFDYFNRIQSVNRLYWLKIKSDASVTQALTYLVKYQYMPG